MSQQNKENILTVTELTSEIRFELNSEFSNIWVTGEISGLKKPSSGHQYFTLKDQNAVINGILWRSTAERLRFEIEDGQKVVCRGDVDVYPKRGSYQLIVQQVRPVGEGSLQLAFRQLHQKLQAEGIFDPAHKKLLPLIPQHIVLITSPTGAAVRDFLQVLGRRWPNVRVTIIPVKVQGPGSAQQIVAAINSTQTFDRPPDVIVLTRGGGSIEDLWSFNEEMVCRAIYHCPFPIISGVGHEVDVTLSDLAADVRALTPSEAAERIVPDRRTLGNEVTMIGKRLRSLLLNKHRSSEQQLEMLATSTAITKPLRQLEQLAQDLDRYEERLCDSIANRIRDCNNTLGQITASLEAFNPLAVLARGYSITTRSDGTLVNDVKLVETGDELVTRLANGVVTSKVQSQQQQ